MKNKADIYCIWITSPYVFEDVALSLRDGFSRLGHDVPVVRKCSDISSRIPIILGPNNLPFMKGVDIPENSILFNLEQICPGSPWCSDQYLALLSEYEVWDYSRKNISYLQERGVKNIKHCQIGYVAGLTKNISMQEDIDVLFYGMLNERRANILKKIQALGVRLVVSQCLWGQQRDNLIYRSRIVLNLHYYESKVLEIVRISYLLANRRFVLSESGADADLDRAFSKGLALAPHESIPDRVRYYLDNPQQRHKLAKEGFKMFCRQPQEDFLRSVIE